MDDDFEDPEEESLAGGFVDEGVHGWKLEWQGWSQTQFSTTCLSQTTTNGFFKPREVTPENVLVSLQFWKRGKVKGTERAPFQLSQKSIQALRWSENLEFQGSEGS